MRGESLIQTGIDVVEVERFTLACRRHGERLLHRLFTPAELALVEGQRNRDQFLAGRFAAKEAVLKALGTGLRGARWQDVEIPRGDLGAPGVMLHGPLADLARRSGITRVLVSISHSRACAVASAIAVGEPGAGRDE